MAGQGLLGVTWARIPTKEEFIPHPKHGEVVIFRDLLTAGLSFPLDLLVVGILRVWNLYLHQLTPNAFVRMALYMWVCKTSRVTPSAGVSSMRTASISSPTSRRCGRPVLSGKWEKT